MGVFILSGAGPVLCHHSHTSLVSHCVQPLVDLVLAVALAEGTPHPFVADLRLLHALHTLVGAPWARVPWAAPLPVNNRTGQ